MLCLSCVNYTLIVLPHLQAPLSGYSPGSSTNPSSRYLTLHPLYLLDVHTSKRSLEVSRLSLGIRDGSSPRFLSGRPLSPLPKYPNAKGPRTQQSPRYLSSSSGYHSFSTDAGTPLSPLDPPPLGIRSPSLTPECLCVWSVYGHANESSGCHFRRSDGLQWQLNVCMLESGGVHPPSHLSCPSLLIHARLVFAWPVACRLRLFERAESSMTYSFSPCLLLLALSLLGFRSFSSHHHMIHCCASCFQLVSSSFYCPWPRIEQEEGGRVCSLYRPFPPLFPPL